MCTGAEDEDDFDEIEADRQSRQNLLKSFFAARDRGEIGLIDDLATQLWGYLLDKPIASHA